MLVHRAFETCCTAAAFQEPQPSSEIMFLKGYYIIHYIYHIMLLLLINGRSQIVSIVGGYTIISKILRRHII